MDTWEWPAELDEFLEYCVEEHGDDWAAISRTFLEVASGLDEQLADRAEEAFSAESLQQRYVLLHGAPSAPSAPTDPGTEVTELTEVDWKEHALAEETPSQFSVLTDSLEERVRRIYNNVQLRLPSVYARDEEDSERASEVERPESEGEDALNEAAVRLFGSTDYRNIVENLADEDQEQLDLSDLSKSPPIDKDPSGLIARALRGEEEPVQSSSEDSAVDDFRAMRQAVKDSSNQLADDPQKPKKPRVQPKVQVKPTSAKPKPKPKAAPGFVRLELVESSSESEEEPEESSEEEEGEWDSHLRVLARLESKAPDGDCPWDVWLQATRSWPQLKAKLNSPDFGRKGGDLRVKFDVELLKKVTQEEKQARADARQARIENIENQKSRVNEYIEEAERRREMMKGRIGGYILAPRNEKLEETLRKQSHRQEDPKQGEIVKPLPKRLPQARVNGSNNTPKKSPQGKANTDAHKAKEEAALARDEQKAKERKQKLVDLVQQVQQHRIPLWDETVSFGPNLPILTARALSLLNEKGSEHSVFFLRWGEGTQRRMLSLALSHRIAECMILLPVADILPVLKADERAKLDGWTSVVAFLARSVGQARALLAPDGEPSLIGPCPDAIDLFRRPLALWSFEPGSATNLDIEPLEETLCVALFTKKLREDPEILETVLREIDVQGLTLVGLRLVIPDLVSASAAVSVSLKAAVKPHEEALLLALRGPHALALWRVMLGPSDPVLARQTDPQSLNAKFGGENRSEALAFAPPSSLGKAAADVAWAFGGRIEAEEAILPKEPLHGMQVAAPKIYAFEISGPLSFTSSGPLMGALLLRCGRVLNIEGAGPRLVVHAMRQGGADFLKHCKLSPPPGDLQAGLPGRNLAVATLESSISVAGHEVRPLAELLQPPPPIPEVSTDEVDEVEPEVLILGLRPQSGLASPLLLQATLEALSHKFQQEEPGAFSSLELLGVRLVDLDTLSSMSGADSALRTTTSMALQGFRSFAQVARHALDEASNYWWSSASGGEAIEHGVVSLICLRGENAIRRFKNFLVREWTLTAATSGEVLFSPTRAVARQCYRAFFQLEEPTFQVDPLSSVHRFSQTHRLSEAICFPRVGRPQQAFALITPPDLNATLYRALTVFEQQGFQLLGAFALGPLPHPWAEALYAQELEDGSLNKEDWPAFYEAMGKGEDEDFRCIFLVLSRQQAVKKVAQLCGAADPEVNHKLLRASLRHGRDRIHNGIRCATSLRSAEKLLRLLEPTVAPRVCLRRLGLDAEAAQQGLQCALLVAVSAQLSHLQLLRDCLHSLQAAHHTVVGLRFSAGWPTSATSDVKVPWRNPMEKVSELIDAGTWPIFLALEGRYVLSAADALSGLKAQGVAFYVASNAQQGAADVAEVFGSLPGARHYLVEDATS